MHFVILSIRLCYEVLYNFLISHRVCLFLTLADYGVDKYDIGAGFGHFGIAVEDVRFYLFS